MTAASPDPAETGRGSSASTPVIGVILAGGTGSRFGGTTPKQLLNLAGNPILHHTLRRFDHCLVVDRVYVAANVEWRAEIEIVCDEALRRVPYEVVDGGGSRNESVRNALLRIDEADDARVLVHDGVRPLVSDALIASVAHRLLSSTCVIPVIPSADPLVVVRDGDVIGFEDRGDVYRGQSPQGFWLSSLRDAFLPQPLDQLSVFATIFEAVRAARGHLEIATVPGDMNNVKITTPVDRLIAGRLLLEDE